MPEHRRWRGLLLLVSAIAVVAGVAGTARADEDEEDEEDDPELSVPSVCAPPCPDGQICVGNRCVVPGRRPTAPPRRRAPTPRPPPQGRAGSAATTAPQPAGPPQPGNAPPPASPPPGYPAAPPPAATPYPPPPGYPPPAGYPQPLGWYYPPPPQPYVQPLGYYYPPPPATPPKPGLVKRRFLALPFLGLHSYQGDGVTLYGPGLRFGTLMGVRISDRFSLDGELTFNFSNLSGPSGRQYSIDLAAAPLFQLPAGSVEIVLGPKLGYFVLDSSDDPATGIGTSTTQNGIVLGINTGIFLPVSATTSMGVLLAFELKRIREVCYNDSIGNEYCTSVSGDFVGLVGLTGAVLF